MRYHTDIGLMISDQYLIIRPVEVVNMPPKETPTDSPKPINQVSSTILLFRAQREERLRKKAFELGEDPDIFMTITEKDRLDSITFQDRMETDSRMCRNM